MAVSEPSASHQTGDDSTSWLRVFAWTALVFVLLEIACQAGIWLYAGKPFNSLTLYKWSPYGLVRNNPDLTSPGFHISENGFREISNHSKAKPQGVERVMLLGGSVLYAGLAPNRLKGYGRVRSDQTISTYLEQCLNEKAGNSGRSFEVINAAVNFNRIVEVSTAYLEEYIKWQPDTVVVFGSVNNFRDARMKGDFAAGKTPLQRDHPWRLEFDRLNNDTSLSAGIERAWRGLAETSAALAVLNKIFVNLADRAVRVSNRFAHSEPTERRAGFESPQEEAQYMRLYQSYADAMIAAARRMRQNIVFAWEPLLGDLKGIKPLSAEEMTIFPGARRSSGETLQYERARQSLKQYFEARDVPFFDPTDGLKTYPDTVFIDYAHYTPDGNRYIAEQLCEQMSVWKMVGLEQQIARGSADHAD